MIRLSKSSLGPHEKAAVKSVLDKENLGMGEEVKEFELLLKDYFGREAVSVINGTSALQLAIQACGISNGDEILVPSLTYIASFQAISATGAVPIACDVDTDLCFLDPKDAEKKITDKSKAIMPVHYAGSAGDLNEIYRIAKKNNLRVIEDAAPAFGSNYKNQRVGSFGDIACFSFDGIKNITCGEGGCVVSGDKEIIEKVLDYRLLGVVNDSKKRYSNQRSWDFEVKEQGWRYHMSNIMAALGIQQFKRLEEFSKKRREIGLVYNKNLKNESKIKSLKIDYSQVVPHIYVVQIEGLKDRVKLRQSLLEVGVEVGFHWKPCHQTSLFKDSAKEPLENTEKLAKELLTLPMHTDLTFKEVDYVCDQLIKAIS
jgi:dTDP-4-amino-4,6-dideoxygalactose transaminase